MTVLRPAPFAVKYDTSSVGDTSSSSSERWNSSTSFSHCSLYACLFAAASCSSSAVGASLKRGCRDDMLREDEELLWLRGDDEKEAEDDADDAEELLLLREKGGDGAFSFSAPTVLFLREKDGDGAFSFSAPTDR
eukprot:CAMPEP_0171643942 /NCGR_PEP_ID=MMETSP0990-20121206/33042_1 /TAXON_ID=483369 /ORGANISM="non described non described, Strain CCMP2098" /LENGTH=134 /DNA_ID=CAMNT_0012219833 /DNA_START=146 /DNA_END=547 /DNA_ORIENTATION=-